MTLVPLALLGTGPFGGEAHDEDRVAPVRQQMAQMVQDAPAGGHPRR